MGARRVRPGGELSPRALAAVMNLPSLVTLALVLAYPIYYAAYLSFHKVALAELRRGVFPFVGLDNYRRIFADPLFLLSLKNTFIFTVVSVGAEIVLAVTIALLINERSVPLSRVTRVLILLPYAVPPIANGLIWAFLYNFDFGFLNRILFGAGVITTPIDWVGNPQTALYVLTIPYIWRTLPFAILLVHAALQGINPELYEAASIDGATAWQRLRHVVSGGAQSAGSIYEQATYLPDNVKKIYYALGNSVVIAGSVTLLTLVFAALSAYAAVRLRLRWLAWLMELSVLARFVPIIVLMIPLYVTFRRLELLNSMWGVIIAEVGFLLPYGILILAPYFAALPQELDEAARIDGCTRFTAFVRITLPLSTPALASFGAIVFIVSWNDLLIPLILNNRAEFMTVPVVVASLVGDVHVFFNLMMALCLLAMAPSVILVLLLQKFVVQGLAAGAVKG